jgi:hypothetical protein
MAVPELSSAEVAPARNIRSSGLKSGVTVRLCCSGSRRRSIHGYLPPPKTASGCIARAIRALAGVWLLVLSSGGSRCGRRIVRRLLPAVGRSRLLSSDRRIPGKDGAQMNHSGAERRIKRSYRSQTSRRSRRMMPLRSITLNDGRAALGAEVAVAGFEALETLKAAWSKEGVSVDVSSAEQQDQQVHARVRLKGG